MGIVYRVSDLKENQFVLARDMIISSNRQYVVVGFFLCLYRWQLVMELELYDA